MGYVFKILKTTTPFAMKRSSSSSQVFHLRQNVDGTIFHLQNVNIKTSHELFQRLTTLQQTYGTSANILNFERSLQEVLKRISDDGEGDEEHDATSGIEYFYMAMALLRRQGAVDVRTIQLLELSCRRDPSSRLLKETLHLAKQHTGLKFFFFLSQ